MASRGRMMVREGENRDRDRERREERGSGHQGNNSSPN